MPLNNPTLVVESKSELATAARFKLSKLIIEIVNIIEVCN